MEFISFLDYLPAFLEKNLVVVFLLYGFSFFLIASAILFSFKSLKGLGLSRAFLYLFLFSLIHGAVEWIDMYRQYKLLLYDLDVPQMILYLRFNMLTLSYYFLLLFGLNLTTKGIASNIIKRYTTGLNIAFLLLVLSITFSGLLKTNIAELEGGVRYLLGFPSAALAGIAFYRLSRNQYNDVLPEGYAGYFRRTSFILISYGIFTGIIVPKSSLLLAPFLNQNSFFEFSGIPIQVLRTTAAIAMAAFIIRAMALKIFYRLLYSFTIFFSLIVILGLTGYLNMNLIIKNYNKVVKLDIEEKDFSSLYKSFNWLYEFLANSNAYEGKDRNPLLGDYIKDFESTLDAIRKIEHEDIREKEMISEISTLFEKSVKQEKGRIGRENLERLKSIIGEISAMHSIEIKENKEKALRNTRNFYIITSVIVLLSFLGFILFWSYLYKMVIRPINKLRLGAGQIAEGNLKYKIDIHTADELQEFAEEFNIMGEKLRERTERLAKVTKELEELSIKDGLTGLFNHRYFYNRMKEELNRAKRNNTKLSLLLIDLDDFKHYNDKHGHLQGDDLLKTLGEIIRTNVRVTDFACRYGGEEFAVILPETDKQETATPAERIRLSIQEYAFPYEETQPLGDITVSIGVSSYPADSEELNDLIKKADDLLYRAKREGKNKVYMA